MKAAIPFSCNAHADTPRFCSGRDAAFAVRLCLTQILMWPERDTVGHSVELNLRVYRQVCSWDDTHLGRLYVSSLSNFTLSELTEDLKTAVIWDLWFSLR